LLINPAIGQKLPYDTEKDFAPVSMVATQPVALVANKSFPADTVAELVAVAKKRAEPLNFTSPGPRGVGHLAGEMLKQRAGIEMTHINYNGSAPALTDLIAGQIEIMFDPLQSVLSNVQGGKIRALAVSSKARSPVVPDVPTIAESGYDGFETTAWWGVFAPAGLPDALAASLVSEIEHIVASEAFRSKLEPLGVTAVADLGGAKFADFQRSEIAKWGKAVQDAHVKID
jgi:tripartite-type tricarboxylate transporter receptor subunit TctC